MGNASGRLEDIADAEMDEGRGHVRRSSSTGYVGGVRGGGGGGGAGGGGGGGSSSPGSPPRPHSPRMFVPQSPVTPLQRASDVPPPVFNQILMRDQDDSDGPPPKRIPTLLVWPHGGKCIFVEGSWDHWTSKKTVQKSGKDHTILLELPSGVYRYRFIVDGERRYLPDLPCETDNVGNIVNLLDVNDFVPESVESVSELMAPPSPDSSYGFQIPEDKEFAKEPPTLPAQLYLGVLNSRSAEQRECARPRHVVLNHLYIEKGWGAQPLVALGHTHRFRSKYVTTVLYKAIER
ncbi:SNF1-related protein kinase regulatory subunit beta-1-like [Triticum dicoccoides]|uniref:SNF1-related protein kinase regulatory subunit beta-1-like n=1 Tax=Triticum dicoccoides TaxID=85692 RepID=UPI00189074F7|nr:SNF1-related protein kinase regulatory subunit beta-1-like [Triticum dicoccoides]